MDWLKKNLKLVIIGGAWLLSICLTIYFLSERYQRDLIHEKTEAFSDARWKTRNEIYYAPGVVDSTFATEYLTINVTDTFFAKGCNLTNLLEDVIRSEKLKVSSSLLSPTIHIKIDGNSEKVIVHLFMLRNVHMMVSHFMLHDHKYGRYGSDRYVTDCIICFDQVKNFPGTIKYENVASWLELFTKELCLKINKKNTQVAEADKNNREFHIK